MRKTLLGFATLAGVTLLVGSALSAAARAAPIHPPPPAPPPRTVPAFQPSGLSVLPTSSMISNRNYWVAPYLSVNQYASNLQALGQAYSSIPPYALGYNPYTPTINYTGSYPYVQPAGSLPYNWYLNSYMPSLYSLYNATNPYAGSAVSPSLP